jgi:two-component system chemotaxis sensor kinase CheA
MQKSIDDETREILLSFVAEGYERLDDAEAQLAKIGEGDNTAALNSIFRLFHSVKGSAGFLGFDNIKKLTHEAETLLDVFLKESIPVTQDAIDVVYTTVDILRKLIEMTERDYTDEAGAEESRAQTEKVSAIIKALRESKAQGQTVPPPAAKEQSGKTGPEPLPAETAAEDPVIANEILLTDLVTRDMVQRFIGECSDLVDRAEKITLAMNPREKNVEPINDIFRAVHTIKGNSGFFGYAYLERQCREFESILDKARQSGAPPGETLVNTAITAIDHIRSAIATLVIKDAQSADKTPEKPNETPPAKADIPLQQQTPEYKPLGEILVDMGVVKDEVIQEALDEQERPIGEILVQKGIVGKEAIDEALKIQKEREVPNGQAAAQEIVRKEIRVDTAKLDKLFELVGELITAESMVINSPDLAGLKLDSFTKSFASLNKISREIQETTMMIRMIPLDGLFQKMTRLVRDLSRKMNRPVNFIVSGQDTEMDKNVIEQVSDPLVHILRNAIDHGIEPREKRVACGKGETGTVTMNAKYEGSEIWISVRDDGAGLNREKIIAKAMSKGMIKGDPANLEDKDVWAFIFEPGFSTAEVVSDVSGRGVGLDVVKKNLEHIRGRIEIKTIPGEGTEFTLAIPLTMAIIDGITVRVGANRYSLPLGDIIEFFKVTPDQITRTGRSEETVNIRSEFLPLIKIGEMFRVKDAISDPQDGIVIVVQNNGRKACLLIDEVVGNQQIVVKSLSEYLGKVEGVSGCSILGDGGVSFIIDTGKLLSLHLE